MEYRKRRKINTLLGLIPLLVLMFSIVGGVTYAVVSGTQAQSEHGFQVNVRGAVNVDATVKGTSYYNGTVVESLDELIFNSENQLNQSTTFTEDLTFDQEEDVVSFVFEITNNVEGTEYTDIIVAPTYTLDEADNISSAMYYSIDGEESYEAIEETKYLVVHQGETIFVKITINISELCSTTTTFDGSFTLDMYSEDGLPADFEWATATDGITLACPTCGEERE